MEDDGPRTNPGAQDWGLRTESGAGAQSSVLGPQSLPAELVRFSLSQRMEHLVLVISFTALVATGVPQKFSGSDWAQAMIVAMGGIETTRLVHRVWALIFCLEGVYHVAYVAWLILRGRFAPSMIPGMRDVADALTSFRYCLGLSPRMPRFDRFDYRQKFEYWGVVMGWIIMVATGLVLMFPAQATRVFPGAFVPASKEMHGGEALLVLLVIVTWHLYGAHLNPLRFPGNLTIFTGRISRERMMAEHPLECARITGIPIPEEDEEESGEARAPWMGRLVQEPQLPTQ